jgi:hypothetical protein
MQLTNSTEQSYSWKTGSLSFNRQLHSLLWKQKVYYRVHNTRHWILSETEESSAHSHTEILYALTIASMSATSPVRLILPDYTFLIIYDEKYQWWSSSYAIFSHSPLTSSFLVKNVNTRESRRTSKRRHERKWTWCPEKAETHFNVRDGVERFYVPRVTYDCGYSP